MTDLAARIIHSYLNNLRLDYIAKSEGVTVAEVEKIIARATVVPSGRLGLQS